MIGGREKINYFLGIFRGWGGGAQWASTLPILSQKASPLNQALVMSALYAFLPGYTPKYITNQFLVKFYPIFM